MNAVAAVLCNINAAGIPEPLSITNPLVMGGVTAGVSVPLSLDSGGLLKTLVNAGTSALLVSGNVNVHDSKGNDILSAKGQLGSGAPDVLLTTDYAPIAGADANNSANWRLKSRFLMSGNAVSVTGTGAAFVDSVANVELVPGTVVTGNQNTPADGTERIVDNSDAAHEQRVYTGVPFNDASGNKEIMARMNVAGLFDQTTSEYEPHGGTTNNNHRSGAAMMNIPVITASSSAAFTPHFVAGNVGQRVGTINIGAMDSTGNISDKLRYNGFDALGSVTVGVDIAGASTSATLNVNNCLPVTSFQKDIYGGISGTLSRLTGTTDNSSKTMSEFTTDNNKIDDVETDVVLYSNLINKDEKSLTEYEKVRMGEYQFTGNELWIPGVKEAIKRMTSVPDKDNPLCEIMLDVEEMLKQISLKKFPSKLIGGALRKLCIALELVEKVKKK